MLSFVDQNTNVKVFRVTEDPQGHVVRERLGLVRKRGFELDTNLETLPKTDKDRIKEMVDFYSKAETYDVMASIYAFPENLRKIVDHLTEKPASFETEMVLMSLIEALRVLRKGQRDSKPGKTNGSDD